MKSLNDSEKNVLLPKKTIRHVKAFNRAKKMSMVAIHVTSSIEWFVNEVCCILAITLTFLCVRLLHLYLFWLSSLILFGNVF